MVGSFDTSTHGSKRNELLDLRKKVVALETAEADNEKLRVELSRIRRSKEDEKSQLELDFLNQLTGVGREHALKLEELQGRLKESSAVNRALSEELKHAEVPSEVQAKISGLVQSHKKELADSVGAKENKIRGLQQRLTEAEKATVTKQQLIGSLEATVKDLSRKTVRPLNDDTRHVHKLREARDECETLRSTISQIEMDYERKTNLVQNENKMLQERLSSRDIQLSSKSKEIRNLESTLKTKLSAQDSKPLSGFEKVKNLEKEILFLRSSLVNSESERKQQGVTILQLERTNKELKSKCSALNDENVKQQIQAREAPLLKSGSSLRSEQSEAAEGKASQTASGGKRTASIIKQLEQNLKHEGNQKKTQLSSLQSHRRLPSTELKTTSSFQSSEVLELRHQLDKERCLTCTLRKEIDALKMHPSKIPSPVSKQPTALSRSAEQPATPRTPVKGMIQSFEDKIYHSQAQDLCMDVDTMDIYQLKGALMFERDQVEELEEELKRQCEVHCALLKEVASLSSDTEVARTSHARLLANSNSSMEDQREIERLLGEVSSLKVNVFEVEAEKKELAQTLTKNSSSDRNEIEGLAVEVKALQSEVSQLQNEKTVATKNLQIMSEKDKGLQDNMTQQIASLQSEVSQLQEEKTTSANKLQIASVKDKAHQDSMTRQITSLQSEVSQAAQNLQVVSEKDKTHLDDMTRQVASLQSEVSQLQNEKNMAAQNLEIMAEKDRIHLDDLNQQIASLQSEVDQLQNEKTMTTQNLEIMAEKDKKNLEDLTQQITSLQSKLESAEKLLQNHENENSENQLEKDRLQCVIQELEGEKTNNLTQIEEQSEKLSHLDRHVSHVGSMEEEIKNKDFEIANLGALVSKLKVSVAENDQNKIALQQEKSASRRSDDLVHSLKEELTDFETKFQALSATISERAESESRADELKQQNEELLIDLKKVKESRDEYASRDQIHQQKFQMLQEDLEQKCEEFKTTHEKDLETIECLKESHGEIESRDQSHQQRSLQLQEDIEKKSVELKTTRDTHEETINRLEAQVKSLQQELETSLESIEKLQGNLSEREEIEETVDQLQRKNQHSMDSQINKLQNELTKVQVSKSDTDGDYQKQIRFLEDELEAMQAEAEEMLQEKQNEIDRWADSVTEKETTVSCLSKEKEQLILSMNDMTSARRSEIDELQGELVEMSTRSANQAREVQSLKLQLHETKYRKEEVDRLRIRVRDLTNQLTSNSASGMHDRTSLEIENSELRQKLRHLSVAYRDSEEKLRGYGMSHRQDGSSSKSVQVLRERNAALKFEVEKLTRKVKKLTDRKSTSPKSTSSAEVVEKERFMI